MIATLSAGMLLASWRKHKSMLMSEDKHSIEARSSTLYMNAT